MQCLVYPLRKIWISADYDDHGYKACDFGWWDKDSAMPEDTGRNARLYAMADGIVLQIVNSHPDEPDWQTYGNYIIIQYPELGYVSLYAHIKQNSFMVKVGDRVSQLQPVCRMDNSGYSYGDHLHLEVCKGSTFVRHGGIDFLPIVYATDWHIVDPDTQKDYNIQHMIIEPTIQDVSKTQVLVKCTDLRVRRGPSTSAEVAGMALPGYYDVELISEDPSYTWANIANTDYWVAANVEGDSELLEASFVPTMATVTKNQAEVQCDDLRIRLEPSTTSRIMGYAPEGFYDVEESHAGDDYVWFKCCGYWIACVDGVLYHAAQEDDKDKRIKELEAEVAELENTISAMGAQLAEADSIIEDLRTDKAQMVQEMQQIADIADRYIA